MHIGEVSEFPSHVLCKTTFSIIKLNVA